MRRTVILKGNTYRNYEVDDNGNIYRRGSDTPLKPFDDGRGYLKVDIMSDDHYKTLAKIHLVVAHTFIGKQGENIINHKDGNKYNNKLKNLEYISQRENVAHAQRLIKGIMYLDDELISKIVIEGKNKGATQIAREYDLPYHVVRDLLQGRTYTHIKR